MNERTRAEDGFTLVELLITIVVMALVTGGIGAAFVTALDGSQSTSQRIRESNDAQLIATYLTRDAQAAGGSDPTTGAADPTLGVSLSDAGGCTSPTGALVARFKWIDRAGATDIPRVATYWYDAGKGELVRRACKGSPLTVAASFALADHLGSVPAPPTASCVPAAGCPGMPKEVRLTISASNQPQNAPSPYTYTLSASLRPEAETPPTGSNASTVPLLLLGGAGCPAGGASGMSSQGGGSSKLRVYGPAFLSGNDPSCPAADFQGSPDYIASGGTSVLAPGTCNNITCTQMGATIPDPFAGLPYPPGTTSGGGCPSGVGNPAPDAGGNYSPGTYHDLLTISGTKALKSGTYIFCNGLTVNGTLTSAASGPSSGVLLYFAGGHLTVGGNLAVNAPTGGSYPKLALWQRAADNQTIHLDGSNNLTALFGGIIYAPTAVISMHNGTIAAEGIIALAIAWTAGGNGGTTIGEVPAPLQITGPASLPTPWTKGVGYPSTTMTASGGAGGDTWSASGLPNGLSIDASSGVISGLPTTAGTFTPTVTVTDVFGATDAKTYTVKVNATPAVSAPSSLPSWTVNRAYPATTATVTGGTAPFTWSAANLPNGMSINSGTGVISGTPNTTGSFSPIISVTDSLGASANRGYSLTISGAPSITTSSLPGASQGLAYSTTVAGTGGTTAYSWSASGLPSGLGINSGSGVISGTPTSTGTATVTITLTDAAGATASKSLPLTVTAVPPTITNVTLANGNGQVASGDTIAVTFSKAIAVNTMCGGWTGNGSDQSLTANNDVVVHLNDNAGSTGNDTVTVTSVSCPTLHFGVLDLGSPNVVSSTRTYSGSGGNKSSITYSSVSFVLTVSLGSGTSGTSGIGPQTISYTPSTSVTDTFGNAISGSYSFAGRRF